MQKSSSKTTQTLLCAQPSWPSYHWCGTQLEKLRTSLIVETIALPSFLFSLRAQSDDFTSLRRNPKTRLHVHNVAMDSPFSLRVRESSFISNRQVNWILPYDSTSKYWCRIIRAGGRARACNSKVKRQKRAKLQIKCRLSPKPANRPSIPQTTTCLYFENGWVGGCETTKFPKFS